MKNVHPQSFFHLRVLLTQNSRSLEPPLSMADKIYIKKGSQYSELPFVLPPEMCKSFVCFGHSMNFFFLFEGCSGVVVCIDQL